MSTSAASSRTTGTNGCRGMVCYVKQSRNRSEVEVERMISQHFEAVSGDCPEGRPLPTVSYVFLALKDSSREATSLSPAFLWTGMDLESRGFIHFHKRLPLP